MLANVYSCKVFNVELLDFIDYSFFALFCIIKLQRVFLMRFSTIVHHWSLVDKTYILKNMTIIMEEILGMLMKLHAELEDKKRFLIMDEIQSLLIPTVEDHKHEDVWMQVKRNASDALIEGCAPNFAKSIEKLYGDYRDFIKTLTNFIKYSQELLRNEVSPPITDNSIGLILKKCFVEKTISAIIENSLSEAGERVSSDQFRRLDRLLANITCVPFDPVNSMKSKDTIDSLKKEIKRLITQIDQINNHIREILMRKSIFDYGDTSRVESEFYQG